MRLARYINPALQWMFIVGSMPGNTRWIAWIDYWFFLIFFHSLGFHTFSFFIRTNTYLILSSVQSFSFSRSILALLSNSKRYLVFSFASWTPQLVPKPGCDSRNWPQPSPNARTHSWWHMTGHTPPNNRRWHAFESAGLQQALDIFQLRHPWALANTWPVAALHVPAYESFWAEILLRLISQKQLQKNWRERSYMWVRMLDENAHLRVRSIGRYNSTYLGKLTPGTPIYCKAII